MRAGLSSSSAKSESRSGGSRSWRKKQNRPMPARRWPRTTIFLRRRNWPAIGRSSATNERAQKKPAHRLAARDHAALPAALGRRPGAVQARNLGAPDGQGFFRLGGNRQRLLYNAEVSLADRRAIRAPELRDTGEGQGLDG